MVISIHLSPSVYSVVDWLLSREQFYMFFSKQLVGLSPLRCRTSLIPHSKGATIGAFLIRAALGRPGGPDAVIPGCYIGTSVSAGEAFVLETMTCLSLVFLAFGIGLDPHQKLVYGPGSFHPSFPVVYVTYTA